jgi:hypothetical protein
MPIPLICSSSPVDATPPVSGHHPVPFGYLILYDGMEIRECRMELVQEPLYVFGAALEHRPIGLVTSST